MSNAQPFNPDTHTILMGTLRMERRDFSENTCCAGKGTPGEFIEHCQQKIAKVQDVLALLIS